MQAFTDFWNQSMYASIIAIFATLLASLCSQAAVGQSIDLSQITQSRKLSITGKSTWPSAVQRDDWRKIGNTRLEREFYSDGAMGSISTSPNGDWIGFATGSVYRIWDYPDGEERLRLRHPSIQEVGKAKYSSQWAVAPIDGGKLLVTARIADWKSGSELRVWDLQTGELVNTIAIAYSVVGMEVSPDQAWLVVQVEGRDGVCLVWVDTRTKRIVGKTKMPPGHSARAWTQLWWEPADLAFTDSDTVLFMTAGQREWYYNRCLYSADAGEAVARRRIIFPGEKDWNENRVTFRHSGLAVSREAGVYATRHSLDSGARSPIDVVVRSLSDHAEIRTLRLPGTEFGRIAFSPDGSRLHVSRGDTTLVVEWELGRAVGTIGAGQVIHVANTGVLMTNQGIWSSNTFEQVAYFYPCVSQRFWATVIASGKIHASEEFASAPKQYGITYVSSEDIRNTLSPNEVSLVLQGVKPNFASKAPADYSVPRVKCQITKIGPTEAHLQVSAHVAGKGIQPVTAYLRRQHLQLPPSDRKKSFYSDDGKETIEVVVPFLSGRNFMSIDVWIKDSLGVESATKTIVIERSELVRELTGRLFVLSVGVSKHKFAEYNLSYPAADAVAIAELFKRQEGLTFGEVHAQIYADDHATLKNVRDGLAWLERVATPDDLAVVFFAGHGLRGRRGLYYVTHEGDAEGIQYTCLNWEEIAKTLGKLKAKQTLFLSDVCHAGGFAKTEVPMQNDLAASLKEIKNLVVLASSGPDELSLEDDEWGHGAFTYALLKGLRGAADTNGDGVSLGEIIEFVTRETSKLTGNAQTPFVPSTGGYDAKIILCRASAQSHNDAKKIHMTPLVTPALTPKHPESSLVLPADMPKLSSTSVSQPHSKKLSGKSLDAVKIDSSSAIAARQETFENSIGMKFRFIPKGTFLMGSTPEQIRAAVLMDSKLKQKFIDRETPQHEVMLTKDFYLGVHEVTRENFREFVEATGYITDAERGDGGNGWNRITKSFEGFDRKYSWRDAGFPATEDHPVVNVSWNDAVSFCKWLSKKEGHQYRLPSEAEWEYAAQAGSSSIYSFGDDPLQLLLYANANDETLRSINRNADRSFSKVQGSDGYAFTAPVGSFRPNSFGLYDMHGNVWEWCADFCGDEYYERSPTIDPEGDATGPGRVFRGGAYGESLRGCRLAIRLRDLPTMRIRSLGFRVARTP